MIIDYTRKNANKILFSEKCIIKKRTQTDQKIENSKKRTKMDI